MELTPEERQRVYEEEKVRSEAKERLKKEAGAKNLKGAGIGCLSLIGLFLVLALVGKIISPERWERASDLQQGELGKYRGPDTDDSTQWDSPRPPIVMRWLIWSRERVRAWYVADATLRSPPPYTQWKIVSFVDEDSKKPISVEEVKRRFEIHQKNKQP
jgi:hypothetical protein